MTDSNSWDGWVKEFITNVGLITSKGPYGDNIMSAEWTHQISYEPALIAVCVSQNHATHENIKKNKEFGISICSSDQNVISSISGQNSGKSVDKIKILKELGYEFYKAKKINVLMVKNASMNAECKLVKTIELGDHTMFVGEITDYQSNDKTPLIYHNSAYWKFGNKIEKPEQEYLDKVKKLIEKYKK